MTNAAYVAAVLADSPSLLWECDDASGNLVDSSGNSRDMDSATGITAYQADGPVGGWKGVTGGTSRAYRSSNSGLTATTDFTLECWLYLTAASGSATCILGLGDPLGSTGWAICRPGTNPLRVTLQGAGSGSNGCNSDSNFPLNTWKHVAITRDSGGTWRMYIDGVLQSATGTGAFTGPASGVTMWNVSANTAPGVFGSQGTLACVAWYPTALSGGQIAAHYAAAKEHGAIGNTPESSVAKSGQQNNADLQAVAKGTGDRSDAFNFSRLPGHGAFIYFIGANPPDVYFPLQNSLADYLGGDPLTGTVQLAGLSGPLLTYAVQLNSSLSVATPFTGIDDFSVLFWLKLAAAPASAVDVFHSGSTGNFWKVAIDSNLKVRAGVENVGNLGVSTTALSLDTWHQIGVSRANGQWVYHIDDALDASTPGSTAPDAPAGNMAFGMISGGTTVIASHLATYNVNVSDAQVADHFNYINRVDTFEDAP